MKSVSSLYLYYFIPFYFHSDVDMLWHDSLLFDL
jgi:hypothetical protein